METRGSPWENGYIESFNSKLRDELLNREIFTSLTEAKDTRWTVAQGIQSGKAPQCSYLQTACSRGYYSVDSNLTSGSINGGRPVEVFDKNMDSKREGREFGLDGETHGSTI